MSKFENKLGATYTFHNRFNDTFNGTIVSGDPLLVKAENGETYPAYISCTDSWNHKYYTMHVEIGGELFTSDHLPGSVNIWVITYHFELSDYTTRTVHERKDYSLYYFTEDSMVRDYNIMVKNYELIAGSRHYGHKIDYTEREHPYSLGPRIMEYKDNNNCNKEQYIKITRYMDYSK